MRFQSSASTYFAISRCSQARARLQSCFTLLIDTPSSSAISSISNPPKKRNSTTRLWRVDKGAPAPSTPHRAPLYLWTFHEKKREHQLAELSRRPLRAFRPSSCAHDQHGFGAFASPRQPETATDLAIQCAHALLGGHRPRVQAPWVE